MVGESKNPVHQSSSSHFPPKFFLWVHLDVFKPIKFSLLQIFFCTSCFVTTLQRSVSYDHFIHTSQRSLLKYLLDIWFDLHRNRNVNTETSLEQEYWEVMLRDEMYYCVHNIWLKTKGFTNMVLRGETMKTLRKFGLAIVISDLAIENYFIDGFFHNT